MAAEMSFGLSEEMLSNVSAQKLRYKILTQKQREASTQGQGQNRENVGQSKTVYLEVASAGLPSPPGAGESPTPRAFI